MSNLFISHSSADNEAAAELRRRLEKKGHESVFLDFDPERGIQAGTSWERTLYTKLRSCRAVVALCSDNYLASHWCFAEIALARMEGKDLFALLIDPLGKDTKLPSILTEDQYLDLRQEPEAGYERLWNGFTVKGIVPKGERQLAPGKAPYPGLRAFDEEDAPIFFGRDDEIRQGVELLNQVRRQGHPRLVMVLGSSGSGKSSLARAGIVPRLRRDTRRWLVVGPFRPGRRPLVELALAFAKAFESAGKPRSLEAVLSRLRHAAAEDESDSVSAEPAAPPRPSAREMLREALLRMEQELTPDDVQLAESIDRLQEYLATTDEEPVPGEATSPAVIDGSPLAALADELRLDSGFSEAKVVLVVDQFEELLGNAEDTEHAQDGENGDHHSADGFLRLLKQGIEAEHDPVLALGTMRSDFLGVLQRSPSLRGVGFKSLSVGPMSEEGMLEVIEQPALLGAIDLEKPALTNRLLRETGTSDALPLLAFTLRAMWDRFGETRRFDLQGYEALGGLDGAIARVADETLEAALARSETGTKKDLRIAFLSLARPTNEGAGWARQPAAWDEMPERVRPMLQHFIDQRLLVMRADSTVEVAHEALFRSWKTLGRWLDANAEGLHLLREVRIDAEKWEQAQSEKDKQEYLWRGGRLARAIELRDRGVLKLAELDSGFLEASDREERRLLAEKEERRRVELEQARELAREQQKSAEKALALADEQRRSARRMRRAAVVIGVFFLAALVAFFYARKKEAEAVAARVVAEDQTRIAVASEWLDKDPVRAALTLLELEEPARLPEALPLLKSALERPLPVHEFWGHEELVMTAAYSPDGERIVTASRDSTARLWTPEGVPLATLTGHAGPLTTAFFSHQGDRIVTAGEDGTIRLWNADGTPVRRTDGEALVLAHDRAVWDVAFSHSGQWIATASKDKKARLWNADGTGEPIVLPIHEGEVNAIAFNSTDERLATGAGRTVRVWRIENGAVTLEQELDEDGEVLSIAFSPLDDRFVTGARDGTVTVWSRADGFGAAPYEPSARLPHPRAVRRAVFSADGAHVFTACEDRAVRRWAANGEGDPRVVFAGAVIPQWLELDPRPDSDRFVTAMVDGTVRIWETENPDFDAPTKLDLPGFQTNVVFAPRGDRLVVAASLERGDVEIWIHDLAPGSPDSSAETPPSAALALDETSVFRSRRAGRTEPIRLAGSHRRVVLHTAFSPAGDRIVTASEDGTAWIWKAGESGLPALDESGHHRLSHPPDPDSGRLATINRAAFDPAGEKVVTASNDGTARLWTIDGDAVQGPDGGDVVLTHGAAVTGAAFSPDGGRVVTASKDGTARVWRADGTSSIPLPHGDEVLSAAFDPSGGRVVTASRDTNAWVWNADGSGEPIRLKGHEKAVDTAAFDRSGQRVVTGSRDETARVWSADGRGEALVLPRHGDWVVSAAFSPTRDRVATTSWFGGSATWLWNVSYELLAARARAATSVCLSPLFREKSLGENPDTARGRYARCRACVENLPRTGRGGGDGDGDGDGAYDAVSFGAYRDCVRSPDPDG